MELNEVKGYPIYMWIMDAKSEKRNTLAYVVDSIEALKKGEGVHGSFYLDTNTGNVYRYVRQYYDNGKELKVPTAFINKEDGTLTLLNVKDDSKFHIKNCFQVDLETISDYDNHGQSLISDQLIDQVSATTNNEYLPVKPQDDFLKKLIKYYFIAHRTIPSSIKSRISIVADGKKTNPAIYSNIMQSLKGDTKLGILYFFRLVNALHANFEVRMWDASYKDNPPEDEVLRYTSWDDQISSKLPLTIPKNEEVEEDNI